MRRPLVHGERRCYRHGCRCLPCRSANAQYAAMWRRLAASGGALVDAAPAREHLRALRSMGVGHRHAATMAGLSLRIIMDIQAGRSARIRRHTSERILATQARLARGQRVIGWGTRRLLHVLKREGFTRTALARRLGFRSPRLHLSHRYVTVRNALKVRALYEIVTEDEPMDTQDGGQET